MTLRYPGLLQWIDRTLPSGSRAASVYEVRFRLEKDLHGGVDGTSRLDEPHRTVEIDVAIGCDDHGARPAVAGLRQLLQAPPNDAFIFGFVYENRYARRNHR